MKKSLILAAILAVISVGAAVAQPRAIGLNLGTGNGLSYQHSLGESNMLDVAVNLPLQLGGESIGLGLGGIVTYDWINPFGTAIPWSEKGSWNWYLGVGGSAGAYGLFNKEAANKWYAGVAGHVGVEYQFWFPLQLSLDIRPTFGLDNTGDKIGFGLAGLYNISIGVRYLL